MSYEILEAKNPVRRSSVAIDLLLTLKIPHGTIDVGFTASQNDSEEHGRILYENANAGIYGPVQQGES